MCVWVCVCLRACTPVGVRGALQQGQVSRQLKARTKIFCSTRNLKRRVTEMKKVSSGRDFTEEKTFSFSCFKFNFNLISSQPEFVAIFCMQRNFR